MWRIRVTNPAQSQAASSGLSLRLYCRRSSLWDGRFFLSRRFQRACQRRPIPWGAIHYNLAPFYSAQRHRPWRNCVHGPYVCGPTDKETFPARRMSRHQPYHRRGKHRVLPIFFASGARPRRHYNGLCLHSLGRSYSAIT